MKRLLFSLLAYSAVLACVWAQASGNERYNELNRASGNAYKVPQILSDMPPQAYIGNGDYIDIGASILYNAKPDRLVAIFNFVQVGENINEINALSNERIKGFQEGLAKASIKPEDIFIDMVSFVPMYEVEVEKKVFSKSYTETPKGFELQKNIHVSFADENKLNDIVTAASAYEIYDLVKVDYMVNDDAKIYAQMREQAQALALTKIDLYKKMGVPLQINRLAAENKQVYQPNNRYASYQAYSLHSIEGKKKGNITVNQVRKPTSIYYDKVDGSNFDMVINAATLSPHVQYAYTLTVRCFIEKPEKPEVKPTIVPLPPTLIKEYFIITPAGDIKQLPK